MACAKIVQTVNARCLNAAKPAATATKWRVAGRQLNGHATHTAIYIVLHVCACVCVGKLIDALALQRPRRRRQ